MAQDRAGSAETLCDPVTLEIVRGALVAIQSEMEAVIERTAMSPFIREKKDFYAALYDAQGRLIAGSNLPVFGDVVGPISEVYPLDSMRPGDIYWFNDCYASKGAVSHSPDQVFVAPVFADGELAAFAQSWAHFNDIGGMRAGSLSPDCTEIFQEGIIVPTVRVAAGGPSGRPSGGAACPVLQQLALSRDGQGRHPRLHGSDPAGRAAPVRAVCPLRPHPHDQRLRPAAGGDRARSAPEAQRALAGGTAQLYRHH